MRLLTFISACAIITVCKGTRTHELRKRRRLVDEDESITTTTTTTTSVPSQISDDDWEFPHAVAIGLSITGISPRGRYIEEYKFEKVAATYGNDTIRILQEQQDLDERNDMFTPSFQSETGKFLTPYGEMTINGRIARSSESTIFTIKEDKNLLVKFQANCLEIRDNYAVDDAVVHPLIFDYWYGRDVAARQAAMEPLFLSPPTGLCETMNGVCDFDDMDEDDMDECKEAGGSIRFMLIRKSAGNSLAHVASQTKSGAIPFHTVMHIGLGMMQVLEQLHVHAKTVHGDIYEKNVLLEPIGENIYHLKLIDFGRASRVMTPYPESARQAYTGCDHFMFTQWMIDGHYWTPRDDLIKTIQMLTHLMYNSYSYQSIEKFYMHEGYEAQKKFKTEGDLFAPIAPWDHTQRLDVVSRLNVTEANKFQIKKELATILDIVRGLNSTNSVIPYSVLRDCFRRCSALALN